MSTAPKSPDALDQVQQSLEQVQLKLSSTSWQTAMGIAGNHTPEEYAAQAIQRVVNYIKTWLIGPETVYAVAGEWGKLSSRFIEVGNDCRRQLSLIKNHWSGLAAENFSAYSDQLLSEIDKASPAAGGVTTNLGNLSQNLNTLRNDTIADGIKTVMHTIVGAINIGNEILQVDLKNIALGPFGVIQYCSKVVTQMANQLSTVITDLIGMEKSVNNSLAQMANSALAMKNSVYSQLPMSGVPAEPGGLNDTGQWDPK